MKTTLERPLSAVEIVSSLLLSARLRGASDIHIEPKQESTSISFRLDGDLRLVSSLSRSLHVECISRIKVLAGIRTDDRSSAHDGSFSVADGVDIDVRVSIVPTWFGEKAVLRLFRVESKPKDLSSLGVPDDAVSSIERVLADMNGLVLISGATGSGKSTTLYSLMNMLAGRSKSVVSLEDPVECQVAEVTQIPITQSLPFSDALRSVLRQDPDVICIGEIRDTATAELAVGAALTGHLVLATLHATSIEASFLRLQSLGVSDELARASLTLSVAQRLVGKICERCLDKDSLSTGACTLCCRTGRRSRIALFDMRTHSPEAESVVCTYRSCAQKLYGAGVISARELAQYV